MFVHCQTSPYSHIPGSIELLLACQEGHLQDHPFFANKEKANEWSSKLCGKDFYGALKPENHLQCFNDWMNSLSVFASELIGPYFAGSHFSLVDAVVFPFVWRAFSLRLFEHYRQHSVHDALFSDKIQRWVDACLKLEEVQATLPSDTNHKTGFSKELFDVYKAYAAGIGLKADRP